MRKGISNKFFTIFGIVLLLTALPLSIKLVQQNQENRSQAAAPSSDSGCKNKSGECQKSSTGTIKVGSSCNVGGWAGSYVADLCTGDSDRRCCVPYKDNGCKALNGKCIKTSASATTCSVGDKSGKIVQDKCGGDTSIRCCVPKNDSTDQNSPGSDGDETSTDGDSEEGEPPTDGTPEEDEPTEDITPEDESPDGPTSVQEPEQTNIPKISFKFAFGGVKPKAMCMTGEDQTWNTIYVSLGNNNKLIKVPFETAEGEKNKYGDQVYKVTDLELYESDFGKLGSENYIKISGAIHTIIKLCNDKQSSKASANCNVKFDDSMIDFSDYPLLAGDLTGETIGMPNGAINGQDFTYLKARMDDDNGEPECGKEGDLNSDGAINGTDVQILKNHLSVNNE